MRILHTADWHLGRNLNNYSLINEQITFVEEFCQIITREKIDVVFICGDVFDTSVSTSEAIKLYSKVVAFLINNNVQLVLISGNHDGSARLAQFSEIVKKSGAHLLCNLDNCLSPIEIVSGGECIDVFGLPYFNIEAVKLINEKVTNYEQAFNFLCKQMLNNKRNSKAFLLSHCFVAGSSLSDSDNSAKVGLATQIPSSVFDGFDYVALGHLHSPQNVTPLVRYAGSPLKYSFSECRHKKSLTVIDTKTMKISLIPLKMANDLVEFTGSMQELLERARNNRGDERYIKLNITDKDSTFGLFDTFKECYKNLCGISVVRQIGAFGKSFNNINSLDNRQLLSSFYDEVVQDTLLEKHYELFEKAILTIEERDNLSQ